VCLARRVGVRRVYGLPCNAHSVLLPLFCYCLPLYDELMKRLLTFTQKCFICDNKWANFMVRYAVWHGRMKSPLGCSMFRCCSRFDFEYERFMLLSQRYIQRHCWSVVSPDDAARAQMLLELLFIRSGAFCLDSFSVSDVKVSIDGLWLCAHVASSCFSIFFLCTFSFCVYFEYDNIINI